MHSALRRQSQTALGSRGTRAGDSEVQRLFSSGCSCASSSCMLVLYSRIKDIAAPTDERGVAKRYRARECASSASPLDPATLAPPFRVTTAAAATAQECHLSTRTHWP